MLAFLKGYSRHIILSLLGMLPLLFLYAESRSKNSQNFLIAPVLDAAGGIERIMLQTTGGFSDFFQKYVTNKGTFDELSQLRREYYVKEALYAQISELEIENSELRKIANAPKDIRGARQITARIVGRSGSPLTRTLRLDRGRLDGIRVGDGVLSAGQVVGRVLKVGYFHADVLLLSSPSSVFDVIVQRSRTRGLIHGSSSEDSYRMKIDGFEDKVDIVEGDRILSSGLQYFLPPGLFVGTVEKVMVSLEQKNTTIIVKPALSLHHVEWAQVLIQSEGNWPVMLRDLKVYKQPAVDPLNELYQMSLDDESLSEVKMTPALPSTRGGL